MSQPVKTILCVDDDEDDLTMLRNALRDSDTSYHIIEAFDGLHALDILKDMKQGGQPLPCLIVLDINMPRMDGKQTLAALQQDRTLAAIPVVLFTTSSSALDKSFSVAKHVELITKPMNVAALSGIASKMLNHCA
jgi:CheY-like chemotaxis protein